MVTAAAATFAAAAAVCVFAFAFALYAFCQMYMSSAAAAAVVGLVFAAALGIVGLVILLEGKFKHGKAEPSPTEKVMTFARERPIISIVAALGAGALALRNPALMATVAAAFLAPAKPRNKR